MSSTHAISKIEQQFEHNRIPSELDHNFNILRISMIQWIISSVLKLKKAVTWKVIPPCRFTEFNLNIKYVGKLRNTFFRVSIVPAYCLCGLYILESGLFAWPGLWPPPFEPFRFMLGRCAAGRCCNWLPGRWGWLLRGYGRCF